MPGSAVVQTPVASTSETRGRSKGPKSFQGLGMDTGGPHPPSSSIMSSSVILDDVPEASPELSRPTPRLPSNTSPNHPNDPPTSSFGLPASPQQSNGSQSVSSTASTPAPLPPNSLSLATPFTSSKRLPSSGATAVNPTTSLSLFHLVFVIDQPDTTQKTASPSTSPSYKLDALYREVVFKMTAALFDAQIREGWVESEAKKLIALRDSSLQDRE